MTTLDEYLIIKRGGAKCDSNRYYYFIYMLFLPFLKKNNVKLILIFGNLNLLIAFIKGM